MTPERRGGTIGGIVIASLLFGVGVFIITRNSGSGTAVSGTGWVLSTLPPGTKTGTNFEAIFSPTLLVGVGFGNSSQDVPYLTMLKQAGVQTVVLETDPTFFTSYNARFAAVIQEARTMGFKIHIINQLGYKSWYQLLNLSYPLSASPTLAEFTTFETSAMNSYAAFHPEYLSVIAEPGLMDQKLSGGNLQYFSTAQWKTILTTLCNTVKAASPTTQTWVDLVPQDGYDLQIGQQLGTVTSLDGIGLDVYGSASPQQTSTSAAQGIVSGGKLGGLTETWAYDLYANPQNDIPASQPTETQWLNSSGIISWAYQNHMTKTFDPFFSAFFVSWAPIPSTFTAASLNAYFNQLAAALNANQRTSAFYAYQNVATNY